ncbi:MAG: hypothetical protein WCD80_05235 [Desulfobaccales bacterium]
MITILASCAVIGICYFPGQDLNTSYYLNAINEKKAQIVEKVDTTKKEELEPHSIQTSLASSLIFQIQTLGKMPVKS